MWTYPNNWIKARLLQEKINPIEYEISKHREYKFLEEQVIAAEANEKTLESLNESIFILDAIKDFKAKEAELQVKRFKTCSKIYQSNCSKN